MNKEDIIENTYFDVSGYLEEGTTTDDAIEIKKSIEEGIDCAIRWERIKTGNILKNIISWCCLILVISITGLRYEKYNIGINDLSNFWFVIPLFSILMYSQFIKK